MEMDSTSRGRPFDRSSRDSATMKKHRLLTEETPFLRSGSNIPNAGGRPLVQRQPALGFRQTVERDRDSEISDSIRGGGGYQPQALTQLQLQQQHQELVSQYRTALAELTFNSKPIITNLTIIAGENLHAAKAIAATICNNIIEVPSDQKLPSLYLLDSIVKNIGRDYIKYFAPRLAEVFIKAYRQVDSTVHSGMRHLFGTWKGVFPPQSLQIIEKELGFQQPANSSSSLGLTASKSEPQPQHPAPARSIHVNPKYLEARQRLQQSSTTAKGPTSDTELIDSLEDTERPDRTTANISSMRPQADPRLKNIQQAQRDVRTASIRENDCVPYNDFGRDSGIWNPPEGNFEKSREIIVDQGLDNSWYGPGSSNSNSTETQRNGLDIKNGFPKIAGVRSAIPDVKLQPTNNISSKRGSEVNRSWKNSKAEEFTWDDMNSRFPISAKSGAASKRDPRSRPQPQKLAFENHIGDIISSRVDKEASSDPLSINPKDVVVFQHQIPSTRPQITPHQLHSAKTPHNISKQDGNKFAPPRGPKNTASPQHSTVEKAASNPVSSLLTTLVAKGLISTSSSDSPSDHIPKIENSTSSMEDVKSVVGFEFKPEIIRRSHPGVITELIIDDLPHQCHVCGLRFKLQERFEKHMDWHRMKKDPELEAPNKASRRWFTNSDDWVNDKAVMEVVEIDGEQMVVADESQCVCVLCGEVFDDFYSQQMDKWMFRKAVYLRIEDGESGIISAPIVHAHCVSENSLSDLRLSTGI